MVGWILREASYVTCMVGCQYHLIEWIAGLAIMVWSISDLAMVY